ncbi:MAG: DUF2911 domain-containing protein [Flavisolibacter sp.]
MKKLFTILVFAQCFLFTKAQPQTALNMKFPSLDKSPMDMAYFPDNYPMRKTQEKTNEPLVARVIYSRPQKNDRVIFGDLIEYGKVWRLGANEATELEFFKDVIIGNKKVAKGRYTLYAIPNSDHWTIIINKDTDTWGAFIYDQKKDILRIDEPVQKTPGTVEVFTMNFTKTTNGANLLMSWENASVTLPISFK